MVLGIESSFSKLIHIRPPSGNVSLSETHQVRCPLVGLTAEAGHRQQ